MTSDPVSKLPSGPGRAGFGVGDPDILHKVRPIDEIAAISADLKASGKTVVQAHGTFDLLHLGHFRHLQSARRQGDALIVTITGDRFVNKGPGRPVFQENLRAEMVASLAYVDWVGITQAPDAVDALRTIKPDIYTKGQDYVNPEGDVTGKIIAEREAVESAGGAIFFTDEVTFSSSELINIHFDIFEPQMREHLSALRNDGGLESILALIERVKDYRVLVVGDAIIDEYDYAIAMGKPPKEDLIATRFQESEAFAGGVFAAANHVASLCKEVEIITILGERDSCEDLIRKSLAENVRLTALKKIGAITTRKRRYVDPSYMRKLFEIYYMDDDPMIDLLRQELNETIAHRANDYDLVIVTDFGHGLIEKPTIDVLVDKARFLAITAQSNSANMGYNLITRYPSADYICIDSNEVRLAAHDKRSALGDILTHHLSEAVQCPKFIVTQGKHGCVTFEKNEITHTIPAFADKVIDTVGAGDAFLAVTAPLVAAGGLMHQIGFIGNVAGAIKVGIVGHRQSVQKTDLIKAVTALLK